MPEALLHLDKRDLKKLEQFFKKAPRQFQHASAGMLNVMAFNTREKAVQIIEKHMTIRDPRFLSRSLRVDKAKGSQPLKNQFSVVGSVARDRFSGWQEQETGKKTERKRVAFTVARAGSKAKKVKPSFRLKPGKDFKKESDFEGKTYQARTAQMFRRGRKDLKRKVFIVEQAVQFKRGRVEPGIYKHIKGHMTRVVSFNSDNLQPKRFQWMKGARRKTFKELNLRKEWGMQLDRQLKFRR